MAGGEPLVVLDARQTAGAYEAGHLRGAWHADANRDLSTASDPAFDPSRGGRHPLPSPETWALTLARWGVTPSMPVVVYDDQSGANAAARAWWMLRSIGHERVALLDGGFEAAVKAGLEITTALPPESHAPAYPQSGWRWTAADAAAVERARTDPSWRVIDVRSPERFRGQTEPIDPVAGHIPGAVNVFYEDNLQDGRFKPPESLRAQYERLLQGIPPARVIVHCGSGVTACHTLLALELAGFQGASLYVGSWSEWCRSGRPRAVGG